MLRLIVPTPSSSHNTRSAASVAQTAGIGVNPADACINASMLCAFIRKERNMNKVIDVQENATTYLLRKLKL